jgi:hypothetical protein
MYENIGKPEKVTISPGLWRQCPQGGSFLAKTKHWGFSLFGKTLYLCRGDTESLHK